MKTLIFRELRDRRISLFFYCFAMVASIVMYASLYPSIQDSWKDMQKLYESFPKELYDAFGIKNLEINSLEQFLGIELFSFVWPIAALFFAVSRAGGAVAGEIEKGVINLYLSLPISRTKFLMAKYVSFVVSLLIFVSFSIFAIIPISAIFGASINIAAICKVALLSLLFVWTIYSVALFASAIFSEKSKVYMIVGGGLLLMYVMNVVAGLKSSFSWLDNYSYFHFFNAQDILSGGQIQKTSIVVFALTILVATILSLIAFKNRDVQV